MSYPKFNRNSNSNDNFRMRSNPRVNYDQNIDQNNDQNSGQNNGQRRYNNDQNNDQNNGQRRYNNDQNNGQRRYNRDQNNNGQNYQNRNNNYQKNQNPNPKMNMYQNDEDLNTMQIKKLLIDYINNTVNLSNYKYKLLEYEDDLLLLSDKTSQNYNSDQDKKYFISPNYMGINGLLVFIKIGDKYLSYIIDKKQLTYNLEKIDYYKVNIIPVNYRLDDTIYNGTIIDGVLLFDDKSGIKKFVINDLYYFRGQNLTENKMTHKILNISSYFESIKSDKILNDTVFIVNKLYEMNEIENLVNKYISQLTNSKAVSGIAFYPEISAQKLIYLFSNCAEKTKPETNNYPIQQTNNKFNNKSTFQPNFQKNEYEIINESIKKDDDINDDVKTLTLKVRKTDTCDVFNLYSGSVLPNKTFKYTKIGLAYLPTMDSSIFCRDAFTQSNNTDILMDCKYDEPKNGWIPVSINTNKKRPDTIQQLNTFIQKTQQ